MSEHSGATIAVVDDNAGTRYATTRILQSAGFRIVEAGNGSEALERIDPSVDLVVLDVNMPDIDGFEVCRRLRRSPVTAHIPVVHLSATFMDEKDRAHGLDTGADGYLTHPVEPQVLVATVGALLRARAADTARRAADAKLRAVFDLVPTGIAMLDSELKFR
ncbi:MAG: response regulator transcription factor, partial [Nevskiales bacterium]